MSGTHDIAAHFTSTKLDQGKVRAFADLISRFEADTGLKPKKVLVNGIPPFHEIPTVEFDIPRTKLGTVVEKLLGNAHVSPNVIINGIPSVDHYQVSVMAGG